MQKQVAAPEIVHEIEQVGDPAKETVIIVHGTWHDALIGQQTLDPLTGCICFRGASPATLVVTI